MILSQEAGSLDKLGGRLQFKNFKLSVVHAILSSPDERYLSAHRLEMVFGKVTLGLSETVIHRDELLNGEIFYTLIEAQVLIERWRREYNWKRPHSSLGYRPPAPVAIEAAAA